MAIEHYRETSVRALNIYSQGNSKSLEDQPLDTFFNASLKFEKQLQESDYVSGRLGISMNSQGFPDTFNYFDTDGNLLTRSTFDAQEMLLHTEEFDIPLTDLKSLGQQLDDNNIGYRPYQLFPGTGSDHGIDFDDIMNGGMGTAFNWTIGQNMDQKGAEAVVRLQETREMVVRRGLTYNPALNVQTALSKTPPVSDIGSNESLLSKADDAKKIYPQEKTLIPVINDQTIKKQLQESDYVSGRLGINMNSQGFPDTFNYFDIDGNLLTRSTFDAQEMLLHTEEFDIPLTDLKSLGQQLDDNNIGYRPYQLFPGTGSDHGIDFDDIMNGGMGTAFNWTIGQNMDQKGAEAVVRLQETREMVVRRGLTYNPTLNTYSNDKAENKAISASNAAVGTNQVAPVVINSQDLSSLQEKLGELNLQKNPEITAHLQALLDLVGQKKV